MEKFITNSFKETQLIGAKLARKVLRANSQKTATVLALTGDLGAGKTTFLQGFAKGLGIKENVLSPTFIIMKKFQISNHKSQINPNPKIQNSKFDSNSRIQNTEYKFFYHFDLYRLETPKDLEFLNFPEIISSPQNIVAIEWPEKIKSILGSLSLQAKQSKLISVTFNHLAENKRELTVTL